MNIDKAENERLNRKLRDIVTGKYQSPVTQRNNFFSTNLDNVHNNEENAIGIQNGTKDSEGVAHYTLAQNTPAYLPGAEKLFTVRNNIIQNQVEAINKQTAQNEYYAQKYKDTPKTYEGYMSHAEHVSDEERKWLEEQASQYATAEDYKKEAEKAQGEYNYLRKLGEVNTEKAMALKDNHRSSPLLEDTRKITGLINNAQGDVLKNESNARTAKVKNNNEYYAEKYKDTPKTFEAYMNHAEHVSDEERQWLESQAEEFATPEDYRKQAEKAQGELNYLNRLSHVTGLKAEITGEESAYNSDVQNRIESADTKIKEYKDKAEQKEYEEKTKDILEGDARVRSIVQQYYAYQKNSEQRKSGNDEAVRIDSETSNKQYTPEQEKRIVENFNNLANEGYDPKALYTYYDRAMQEQASIENLQKIQQDAMNNPVGASAWSVLDNAVGSVGDAFKYIGAGIAEDITGEKQWINTYDTAAARVGTVRSTVSDIIGADIGNETAGKLASFLYQTGMSLADFAATLPLELVPGIGTGLQLALMSTEAGASAAKDAYDNTGSAENALGTGIMAGIAESFFEKFSIEKLKSFESVSPDSVKSILKNAGKQMITEASEEGLTTIANTLTDYIINGDMSAIAREYQGYIDEGYTQEEANAKCAESFAKQVGLDAAGGAVSGLALGGGVSAVSYAKGKINANYDLKKSAEELGKEAMASKDFDIKLLLQEAKDSGNEKAISIANAVEKKINGNKSYKVNSVDVGNLMKLIGAESFEGAISKDGGENADTENEAATNENIKALSKKEIAEHITYNFGNSHKNGIIADDRKGHSVVVKGFESSTRSIGEADNKVRVITEDGKVYNADDLLFSSPEYNRLMNAAKNFDTNGAGVLLQEYGDYVEFKGKVTDINERINDYVNSFSELYEAGKMGGSYERVASSKYFGKYIDAIGPQRAIKAVEAGNKDSELFFNNEEKLVRIDRSANVKANVYVEKSAEEMVNLDEGKRLALEKLSEMTGKEIVLTGDMDENGRIDFREGKIYIRASLDGNYILPVAMHETMHSFRRESPTDYRLIRNFVVDYLFASGKDVMKMVEDVKLDYGDRVTSNEDCIEEIVCNSIMAIAGDEGAMGKALQVAKAEEGVLKKLSEAIKSLASKIKEFILTHTTNKAAQAFAEDVKALDRLAEMFSNAADNIKAKSDEVITSEQKNNTAEGVGNVKYSIKDNVKNKDSGEVYDKVVVLDTNIFKGIPPRNWGKTFRSFISEHLIGKKFSTFDENGKEEIIEFAKPNERVTKNGAKNSHKVIDKLSRKSDRNSKLVIVHSDEVINISEKQNENAEHSHQWLDENGWEFRKTFVMDKHGKLYSVTLNIAKSKDGRNILYDINKINEVGYGDVLSNAKGKRSSHINPNFVNNSISESRNNVNTKNDENSKNKKYAVDDIVDENRDKTGGKEFIRWFGDWQNEPQSASKVVDSNGEPLVVYHQTENDFNVFDTNKKGAGEFDSEMPTGIFMKPTNSNIGLSGNKQMALYANIRNPLTVNNRAELVRFYEQNIDGYKDAKDYISNIDSEYKKKFEYEQINENKNYQKLWNAKKSGEITEEDYQKALERDVLVKLVKEWHNKVNEASKEAKSLIDDYFRSSDYDGVIVNSDVGSFGRSTKTYIAFENTQVKSATDNIGTYDRNNSDIRYAVDDTLNDWLDDENTPLGIDYEKVVEKNPVVAVAKIYNSASKTAESGLRQGKSVKLEESDYKRIANRIMQNYGIKGKHNPNYKAELTTQIAQFVENTSKKNANFTELFEGLVENCKSGILLSGDYDTETLKTEREYIFGLMRDNTLLIKPRDVEQIEEDYGSVANYRKKMFGKTSVAVGYQSNNNSYFIEDIITHVEDWFPYLIDENADGDMGYLWLENLVNNVLKPKYKNPYFEGENSFYETPETAAIQMAFDCTTQIINAKAEKLKADNRADKKVLRDLQTQQKEANKQVKDLVEAKTNQYKHELAEAKKRNTELWKKNAELRQEAKEEYRKRVEHSRKMFARYNKTLEKLRVERNKNIYRNKQIEAQKAIIASHYKTIREEYNENREKTLYLNKLGTMCDRLTKRLNGKAKNNEYIPDSLKGPIIDVLSCFTANDAKGATPEYFGEWNRLKEIGQRVADLESAYRKLNGNQKKDTKDVPSSFIDIESIHYKVDVMNQLEKLKELVEGHNIYTLTSNELVAIYDTMQMLDQSLRDAVQIIINGKKVNFMELSEKAINEVKTNKPATDYSKTKNVVLAPVKQLGKSFISTHLDPVRYGRMLSNYHDDSIINELFSGLHAGENKAIAIQHRAISRIKEVTTKYANEIKNIQNEDVKEFDFYDVVTGRRVPITKGELLAIYLTDRQKSGHIHLLGGTEESYINNAKHFTVLPNLELNNKKQKRTAKENLHKVRFGIDDLKQIERYVQNDKVLMELAEAISKVYNQTLRQEINEVSMAKYGMKIATVKNY